MKSGLKQVMHQSLTAATLGPGKCRGLWGLSTVIVSGSCVVLVVSSAVVVRGFRFPAKYSRGVSRLNTFGGAGLSAGVLNQKISPGCREYTRAL